MISIHPSTIHHISTILTQSNQSNPKSWSHSIESHVWSIYLSLSIESFRWLRSNAPNAILFRDSASVGVGSVSELPSFKVEGACYRTRVGMPIFLLS